MRTVIALEGRLRFCRNVLTLGVKPNFEDYGEKSMGLIRRADTIYYPSRFYAALFDTMRKKTFPSHHTYTYAMDKIKQSALFQLLEIPHPRTRVFYGKTQQKKIFNHFTFPMVAKIARGSSMGRGVFLINDQSDLDRYLEDTHVAYIQEYIPMERDCRVVVTGGKVIHAYWRNAPDGDFRTNFSTGGTISFEPIPERIQQFAIDTARRCCFDDVGLDICQSGPKMYVIEANMKYGRAGFTQAGIDFFHLMETLIEQNVI
jgi:ribosomal protein S6--L-glutamate ligase